MDDFDIESECQSSSPSCRLNAQIELGNGNSVASVAIVAGLFVYIIRFWLLWLSVYRPPKPNPQSGQSTMDNRIPIWRKCCKGSQFGHSLTLKTLQYVVFSSGFQDSCR